MNNVNDDLIHAILYSDDNDGKINVNVLSNHEIESEITAEWCPNPEVGALQVDSIRVQDQVQVQAESVPRVVPESVHVQAESLPKDIPEELSAVEAMAFKSDKYDYRPHLFNPVNKQWSLVVSIWLMGQTFLTEFYFLERIPLPTEV